MIKVDINKKEIEIIGMSNDIFAELEWILSVMKDQFLKEGATFESIKEDFKQLLVSALVSGMEE